MGVDVGSIRRRVASVPQWYHNIELPGGIVTPGKHHLPPLEAYDVPEDLSGARVLDVGAWDGLWTFEVLRRGASEVVAIDDGSDMQYIDGEPVKWHAGFDVCRDILGEHNARFRKCEAFTGTVYELEQYGKFDAILCFGVLYHLRHPLLGIERMVEALNPGGQLFIETATCNDISVYQGGIGHGYKDGHVVMEFYPTDELAGNPTNWWAPTGECLRAMLQACELKDVDAWRPPITRPLVADEDVCFCRGFAKGTKCQTK